MANHENSLVAKFGHEKRWVNWKYEERDGKITKVPYAVNGKRASSVDSSTWSTYAEVSRISSNVGIIFTEDQRLLGIDIDHVVEDGVVSDDIQRFIDAAETYTEISPSGTGLHLFLAVTEPLSLTKHKKAPYELYTSKRFFTVTRNEFTDSPVRTVTPEEALRLLAIIGYPWNKDEPEAPAAVLGGGVRPPALPPMADEELLEKMFASKNGHTIRALYRGDISSYENDDSRADMALCAHLAYWTHNDGAQMERIWLASGLGQREKTQGRKDYRERTIAAAIEGNAQARSEKNVPQKSHGAQSVGAQAITIRMSDVQPKPIEWLWFGRIALGKLTIIAGDPGLGKSLTTIDMAARVSKGCAWPLEGSLAPLGNVVFLSAEDDPGDTIRPRLDAAGADCSRVHVIQAIRDANEEGRPMERMFSFRKDITVLEDLLRTLSDCRLLVIDPVSAYLDGTKSHENAEVRQVLAPLAKLAADFGVAVVVVQHLNKNSGDNAMYRSMGSIGFVAAARAAYIVTKDKDNQERRLVMPIKNNLAKDTLGLAYSVVEASNRAPMLVWESEAVTITADEALGRSDSDEEKTKIEWAIQVLEVVLADGPVAATEVNREARQAGISQSTLHRAKDKLGVKPKKASFKDGWVWSLPNREGVQISEDATPKEVGILGMDEHLGE
ncbi:MAG: AAA family ATPase [Candidatus Pacebacteria bacterium]|nr:AAA family ATPase [Candidatus Paceibacterota bacterium]